MGASNERRIQLCESNLPSSPDCPSIFFEASIRDQCQSNEAILSSRTGDRSLLFEEASDTLMPI